MSDDGYNKALYKKAVALRRQGQGDYNRAQTINSVSGAIGNLAGAWQQRQQMQQADQLGQQLGLPAGVGSNVDIGTLAGALLRANETKQRYAMEKPYRDLQLKQAQAGLDRDLFGLETARTNAPLERDLTNARTQSERSGIARDRASIMADQKKAADAEIQARNEMEGLAMTWQQLDPTMTPRDAWMRARAGVKPPQSALGGGGEDWTTEVTVTEGSPYAQAGAPVGSKIKIPSAPFSAAISSAGTSERLDRQITAREEAARLKADLDRDLAAGRIDQARYSAIMGFLGRLGSVPFRDESLAPLKEQAVGEALGFASPDQMASPAPTAAPGGLKPIPAEHLARYAAATPEDKARMRAAAARNGYDVSALK